MNRNFRFKDALIVLAACGVLFSVAGYTGNSGIIYAAGVGINELLTVDGVISVKEQDSAPASTGGYGKIYAKSGTAAPYISDSYTKPLLHADGVNGSQSFTDSSANNHQVTAIGNVQVITAQSEIGGASAYFDGSGDYYKTSTGIEIPIAVEQ